MFSAHCMGISVHASQWDVLKGRCPVIGWHRTVFIWLWLTGKTSFACPCRWYSRCGMKIATDVVEMPKRSKLCASAQCHVLSAKSLLRGDGSSWQLGNHVFQTKTKPLDHISSPPTLADERTKTVLGEVLLFQLRLYVPRAVWVSFPCWVQNWTQPSVLSQKAALFIHCDGSDILVTSSLLFLKAAIKYCRKVLC